MRTAGSGMMLIALALLALPARIPETQAQTPLYQGRQVTILVGFSAGGGTDLFARVIAEHLGRHVAGRPTVLVRNMPGAGSMTAANVFAGKVARDGLTIMAGSGQLLLRILLGLDGSTARLADVKPIAAVPMGRITYATPSAGLDPPSRLLRPREPLILAVPDIISTIDAVIGLTVLKATFRTVIGYPGKNDTRLALERGEVNLDNQATPVFEASVRPLVKAGRGNIVFAQGLMAGEAQLRDPALPDVPTVAELYRTIHGTQPSGPAWEAYKACVLAVGNGGKLLLIHPDIPTEARDALERGVIAMARGAEFLKAADTVLEGYGFVTGPVLAASVNAIAATRPTDLAWLRELLAREFKMSFGDPRTP